MSWKSRMRDFQKRGAGPSFSISKSRSRSVWDPKLKLKLKLLELRWVGWITTKPWLAK